MIRKIWRLRYSYYNLLSNHSVRCFASETEVHRSPRFNQLNYSVYRCAVVETHNIQLTFKAWFYTEQTNRTDKIPRHGARSEGAI